MKKLIFILIVIFSSQLFGQISGKSKAGSLFSKKSRTTQDLFSAPTINISSPTILNGYLRVSDPSLIIQGNVQDEYGIKESSINGEYLNILASGEFFYELNLEPGETEVTIEIVNEKEKKALQKFMVNYLPETVLKPEIILYQPSLTENKDYTTSDESISIKGIVQNLKDGQLKINSIPITVSDIGEFSHELNLYTSFNPVTISVLTAANERIELKFNVIKTELSVPVITIIEPILPPSNQLNHNETIITIRGRVDDEIEVRSIEVNNQRAALLGKNEFFANVNLNDGINNIVVTATNLKGAKSEKIFKIITPVDDEGPKITILEPPVSRGLRIVRKTDVLNVKGIVTDRSGTLNLQVNNRDVSIQPNKEFNTKLFLGIGNNTIIVKATDNKYNVTIDTFYVERKLEEVIKTGKYIALLIGINSYDGYWHSLQNAVNDAYGLKEVLDKNYHFDEIHTLIDEEATRKNIIKKFEWLINNSSEDDNILIFYAGHGQFKRELNKGYWVPVDAKSNSTADYISNSDIKTYISGIRSKHTLLISDACFAGDIFRGSRTESIPFDPSDMTKYYKEVYKKPSRLALTSGSLEQVSDAGKDNHSIFTYYLLKSLEDNDQKYLDASQLFNDFRMAVVNNSDQTPQLQVVRDTNDEGGQFIFIRK